MKRPILALAVLAAFACAQSPGQEKTESGRPQRPKQSFADFRVPAPLPPRKGRADFVTPERFLGWERLLPALAKEGPDFAGYYAVAQWSCGSACIGFGLLDVRNAKLHEAAFNVSYFCPDYGLARSLSTVSTAGFSSSTARSKPTDRMASTTDRAAGFITNGMAEN